MSSWPMRTPASSVPTTVPRLNEPNRSRPMKKPTARVRKMASSGCSRRALTKAVHGGPRYFFGARFEASKASR